MKARGSVDAQSQHSRHPSVDGIFFTGHVRKLRHSFIRNLSIQAIGDAAAGLLLYRPDEDGGNFSALFHAGELVLHGTYVAAGGVQAAGLAAKHAEALGDDVEVLLAYHTQSVKD